MNPAIPGLYSLCTLALRLLLSALLVTSHASATDLPPAHFREPPPADYERGELSELPSPNRQGVFDLRSYDLRSLDLSKADAALWISDFDTRTRWPDSLPSNFSPASIAEIGRTPGLHIRSLHEAGLIGRGVSIGIIDQPLLLGHQEYSKQLAWYREEENVASDWPASMHGPAVASLALGQTVGVAPASKLYFVAAPPYDPEIDKRSLRFPARALRRLIALNARLSPRERIRVVSMSFGWMPDTPGAEDMEAAIAEADAAGIFPLSVSLQRTHHWSFLGLGRRPNADPGERGSYGLGFFWEARFRESPYDSPGRLLVPMDSRTTAAPQGDSDYAFYRSGGMSWTVPWLAGLYALACQADPAVTPTRFWKAAESTARPLHVVVGDRTHVPGRIIEPLQLLGRIVRGRAPR